MRKPISGTSALRKWAIRIHRWLGVGAGVVWLMLAVTGVLISFHFEIEDSRFAAPATPTDFDALEARLVALEAAGPPARVNSIWSTAGLPDRYVIDFTAADGSRRQARVAGNGDILDDRPASDMSFLALMRGLHIDLVAGKIGGWILAVSGILLVTNLISGIYLSWPRRRPWKQVLNPAASPKTTAGLHSWHRAVGLWAVIPGLVVAATGTLFHFEHELEHLFVAGPELPANAPTGQSVGFAVAARAAERALPRARFVGTTMPTEDDASYPAWVNVPGELYRRDGYGSSLVVVDANNGSVRGAYPATEATAGKAFLQSFYPLHTGEAGGMIGRVLVMLTGFWLAFVSVFGLLLWWRRRPSKRERQTEMAPANAVLGE